MIHPLEYLQPTTRVLKRAQYEAFEFAIDGAAVEVTNHSHAEPQEHRYRVAVRNGLPVECECPADEQYEGPCKHRVAVGIRRPLLEAVPRSPLVADGGEDACPNDQSGCCGPDGDELPCFACYLDRAD